MFDVKDTRWSSVPSSSSPPSSPTAYNDSSPPSSPSASYSALPDNDSGGEASPPVDPFAASAKRSWIPPEYEKGAKKNRQHSPSSPSRGQSKKPRLLGPESSLDTLVAFPSRVSAPKTEQETEAAIWDAAGANMYDSVSGKIELMNSNLTSIPEKFIDDLRNFYVAPEKVESSNATREFSRSFTAPAILFGAPDRPVGSARQAIQLYLGGNQICRLPIPLLHLDKMTVLSLRNNRLKSLPPEVRHLLNLHTLNVAGNQLQDLPAEIRFLKLKTFQVFPNPFIRQPSERSTSSKRLFLREKSQWRNGRVAVSSTSRTTRIPSLVELSFRCLFSTDSTDTTNHADRRIEKTYALALCEGDVRLGSSGSGKKEFRQVLPPHLRHILNVIHPGSVDPDASWEPVHDDPPSLGVCPSPHHPLNRASVFVRPAEKRHTWETVIAGVDLGDCVPLKWRGCLHGCLDFLEPEVQTELPSQVDVQTDVEEEHEVATRLQLDRFSADDFDDDG
ncbi:hypothetical protein K438DRAFT_1797202 [Mycena galopus ATCC 62051]|nr:hypothetical protein K438DRAFT_1797202 [Mycena galopus ATCC 62051]